MIDANFDPETEQIREVYALFGLAIFQAQCLERQLALILASKYGPGLKKITKGEYEGLLESLFRKPLGHLINEIGKITEVNDEEKEQLKAALNKRNWLAHHYFWNRATEFMSVSGRTSMQRELREAIELFGALDEIYTTRTIDWGETVGISQQAIEEHMERLRLGTSDYLRINDPEE